MYTYIKIKVSGSGIFKKKYLKNFEENKNFCLFGLLLSSFTDSDSNFEYIAYRALPL